MPVKLTDKVYNEGGSPVQGAVAQAVRTNGTTNTVVATDITDTRGIWAFDTSIAGHQPDLVDPPAGEWYDVRINIGMQYRLRYGAIKAMMKMVYLAQDIVLGAAQSFDASLAAMRIPARTSDQASPGAGQIEFRTDLKTLKVHDGTNWTTLGSPEEAYVGSLHIASGNYTVVKASNVMYVWCQAAITVTLTAGIERPVTVRANVGQSTVASTSGSVIGGSAHPTTGAVQNGVVAVGEAFTYKWDGTNWAAV